MVIRNYFISPSNEFVKLDFSAFEKGLYTLQFNFEDGNSFKAYGSATTKIGKYREYIDYQMKDAYRNFDNLSPWEGMSEYLPGDEKAKAKND